MWPWGFAPLSGVLLLVILLVMVVMSQSFVRKSGYFELFHWCHKLYIPFYVLFIIHAPNCWKWFVLPGLVFVVEKGLRFLY